MDTFTTRSPNSAALWAELHREELLREAAASRRARTSSPRSQATTNTDALSLVDRVRSAFGSVGRQAQPECTECA